MAVSVVKQATFYIRVFHAEAEGETGERGAARRGELVLCDELAEGRVVHAAEEGAGGVEPCADVTVTVVGWVAGGGGPGDEVGGKQAADSACALQGAG